MFKRKLAITTAAFLLALGIYATPVFARNGSDDTNKTTTEVTASSDSSSGSDHSTDDSSQAAATQEKQKSIVEQESNHEAKDAQENELETETNHEISDMLKVHEKHSDTDRQKNCTAAKKGLETKLQSLSTNATSFHVKIGTALNLAIAYQKDNNITVTNFDQLVAAAQTAQGKAAASVSVLNGLSPTLDCALGTVASNVANFKVASKQARTDLLAYKDAVKAVLQALETAKEGN